MVESFRFGKVGTLVVLMAMAQQVVRNRSQVQGSGFLASLTRFAGELILWASRRGIGRGAAGQHPGVATIQYTLHCRLEPARLV